MTKKADFVIIAVSTPVTKSKDPDELLLQQNSAKFLNMFPILH
jgi:UDP-N-acetyl-D-mannosaminuronate dehydrogenase